MGLSDDRIEFSVCIAEHLLWINSQPGYRACFDELTERVTEKDPTSDHRKNSLHHVGLAADINIYKVVDGKNVYLSKTEDHLFSGLKWEKRNPRCRWGGRFSDGNHYSWEYQGRK